MRPDIQSPSNPKLQGLLALALVAFGILVLVLLSRQSFRAWSKNAKSMAAETTADDPWRVRDTLEKQKADAHRNIDEAERLRSAEEQMLRERFDAAQRQLDRVLVELQSETAHIQAAMGETRAAIAKATGELIDPGPEPTITRTEQVLNQIEGSIISSFSAYPPGSLSFAARKAAWWLKKMSFDEMKAKVTGMEERLSGEVAEANRLAKREALLRLEKATSMDQYRREADALSKAALETKAGLQRTLERISTDVLSNEKRIHEAAVVSVFKERVRLIWGDWVAPVLHLGLMAALFLFVLRTSFRLAVLQGWIGTSRV